MAIRVSDVNDEFPVINYNDEVAIPEELPVGYVISGLFSATDVDVGDNMTFVLEGDCPGCVLVVPWLCCCALS